MLGGRWTHRSDTGHRRPTGAPESGHTVESAVGCREGCRVGCRVGCWEGCRVECRESCRLGCSVGCRVGGRVGGRGREWKKMGNWPRPLPPPPPSSSSTEGKQTPPPPLLVLFPPSVWQLLSFIPSSFTFSFTSSLF